jgi:hypothetical protein
MSVIGSPPSLEIFSCSGESRFRIAFCSGVAGASIRS